MTAKMDNPSWEMNEMAKRRKADGVPKLDAHAGGPRYHGKMQPAHRAGSAGGMHGKRGHEAGPGGSYSGGRHAHQGQIGTRNAHRASSTHTTIKSS